MKRYSLYVLSLWGAILLLSSCQKDNDQLTNLEPAEPQQKSYANVDARLWEYFERFEEEAAAVGLQVDLAARGITGVIEEIDEEHVAGQCNYNFRSPNHVIVDLGFWNRASDRFKEFIIFHELGHCYLLRGHREDAFTNGVCVSLMRSGTQDCVDNYNSQTRESYVTELFFPDQF